MRLFTKPEKSIAKLSQAAEIVWNPSNPLPEVVHAESNQRHRLKSPRHKLISYTTKPIRPDIMKNAIVVTSPLVNKPMETEKERQNKWTNANHSSQKNSSSGSLTNTWNTKSALIHKKQKKSTKPKSFIPVKPSQQLQPSFVRNSPNINEESTLPKSVDSTKSNKIRQIDSTKQIKQGDTGSQNSGSEFTQNDDFSEMSKQFNSNAINIQVYIQDRTPGQETLTSSQDLPLIEDGCATEMKCDPKVKNLAKTSVLELDLPQRFCF